MGKKQWDDLGQGIRNVGASLGQGLTNIGNSIFGKQKKTFSDIQVENLLTLGAQDKDFKKKSYRGSGGYSSAYMQSYATAKRQYKKTFRKSTFENLGYLPSSSAVTRTIVVSMVETYLEGLTGYADITVTEARDTYMTKDQKCAYGRRQLTGYDFDIGKLVDSGKTYDFSTCAELSDTSLRYTLVREFEETVVQNLTDNYGYDGTHVYSGGEKYLVGEIVGTVVGGSYTTICVHEPKEIVTSSITASSTGGISASVVYLDDTNGDGKVETSEITDNTLRLRIYLGAGAVAGDVLSIVVDGITTNVVVTQDMLDNGYLFNTTEYLTGYEVLLADLVILTPVESITRDYSNGLFDDEVTYVVYYVTSGEVGTETRYFIAAADTLNIYSNVTIDISPILPVKQNFNIVDPGNKTLAQAMRRFGLGGLQLETTLSQEAIHSAYIMMGVDPTVESESIAKVLFLMFDLISAGSGNIVISINNLGMRYEFTMVKSVIAGSIGTVGTYNKTLTEYVSGETCDDEGSCTPTYDTRMRLRYQGSSNQYREITITNFLQTYTVGSRTNSGQLDDAEGACRLIIPLDILNGLRYNDWVDVYERSLCLLVYAQQTVELDWYQQDWFRVVLQIVALVLMIVPGGQGAGSALQASINLLVQIVIIKLALYIAERIGGPIGAIIAAAVAIYLTIKYNNYTGAQSAGWLPTAAQGAAISLQIAQHMIDMELQEIQKDQEQYMNERDAEIKRLNELNAEYESNSPAYDYAMQVFKEFDRIGSRNPLFQTTEAYVSSLINTEGLVDGSWLYDIDGQIESRKQVYVGV